MDGSLQKIIFPVTKTSVFWLPGEKAEFWTDAQQNIGTYFRFASKILLTLLRQVDKGSVTQIPGEKRVIFILSGFLCLIFTMWFISKRFWWVLCSDSELMALVTHVFWPFLPAELKEHCSSLAKWGIISYVVWILLIWRDLWDPEYFQIPLDLVEEGGVNLSAAQSL